MYEHYHTTTQKIQSRYIEHGYEPIPLKPNEKIPVLKDWQKKSPFEQWHKAPEGANVGLRAGNGIVFIDADDKNQPGATDTVIHWLEGKGFGRGDYPMVRTPNHGTHVYAKYTGNLAGSYLKLKITAGELRYGAGAYVAAPPSAITSGAYQLLAGNIARLPVLDMQDIAELVDVNKAQAEESSNSRMPALAVAIASGNPEAVNRYPSRSEAEAALALSLVNAGYDYAQIKRVFDRYPCAGKYAELHKENHKRAEVYLLTTFRNAKEFSRKESPTRQRIAELIEQVEAEPWSNVNKKNVYLAHLRKAYTVGKDTYAFAVRDIAQSSRLGMESAYNHTRKLVAEGLLAVSQNGTVTSAAVYTLQVGQNRTLPKNNTVRKCSDLSTVQHDAFRNGSHRLGRRAGQVYALLLQYPMTEKELAEQTGAHIKTIQRALKKLSSKVIDGRTGEVIELVAREADVWYANKVDLDLVARIMDTYGATDKQRLQYEQERRVHKRGLLLGKLQA